MEKNSLKVIDNFMDLDEFKSMSEFLLGMHFPWFYGEHVSLDPTDSAFIEDPLAIETWGFHHSVFEREWNVKSFTYENLIPFFNKINEEFRLNEDDLIRARLSLKFQKQGFTNNNYNMPHVDYYYPHESFIFYLNDSDGDTRIFNEWYIEDKNFRETKFSTQSRVTPKANRLIWINGLQYHTASNPIESHKRAIINLNYRSIC